MGPRRSVLPSFLPHPDRAGLRQTTMRYKTLVAVLCAAAIPLQAQVTPPTAPTKPPPRLRTPAELKKVAERLEVVSAHLQKAVEHAGHAAHQAQAAEAHAQLEGNEPAALVAAEAQRNLRALMVAIDAQIVKLGGQQDRLAAGKPFDAWERLKELVGAAERNAKLEEADKDITTIELDLERTGKPEQLAWVRYRHANVMRQHAELDIKIKPKRGEAADLLNRAATMLLGVADGPDVTGSPDGSSLRASSLRQVVCIRVMLCEGYLRLGDRETAKKHSDHAATAFERLERVHPTAVLHDGTRAVDAAKADMERLRRK